LETIIDYNRIVIEDVFNVISFFKIKGSLKNKLSEDPYKLLKNATKLEKEIENTIQSVIEEIEKENSIIENVKQLDLMSGSVENSKENGIKYYNIKHVQVY